jgi:membrane associated rhomboid family serine protease
MFPLYDNIPSRTTPFGNYIVIALCTLVFLGQWREGDDPEKPSLVERYGMIPSRISHPDKPVTIAVAEREVVTPFGVQKEVFERPAAPSAVAPALTMLTCLFLHGGWLHFLGNMWFLHIFGDNVEDRFGHAGFLGFYVAGGGAASLVHFLSEPGSTVPTIGASGAIAAVMGAYFVWYPHAYIKTLIPIFFFPLFVVVPATLFLAVWFILQFFQGATSVMATEHQGVAWWAHVGGFGAGYLIAGLLGRTPTVRPRVTETDPNNSSVRFYRYGSP